MNKKASGFSRKKNFFYHVGALEEEEMLRKEFELSLRRKVAERIQRGLIKTYKPVMDDAPYRIFATMQEYNEWCERALPTWLGYGKGR